MKGMKEFLQSFSECGEGKNVGRRMTMLRRLWETCQRSDLMLWALDKIGFNDEKLLRLYACACVRKTPVAGGRSVWDLLTDDRSRKVVGSAERYARGEITKDEHDGAWDDAMDVLWETAVEASSKARWNIAKDRLTAAAREAARDVADRDALSAAVRAAWGCVQASSLRAAMKFQADLLREMIPWDAIVKSLEISYRFETTAVVRERIRMIDPAENLIGAIREIQHVTFSMAESLKAAIPAVRLTIADIAKRQGVSKSTIYREAWRMPGFGKPDAGDSPVEFWLSSYITWMAIPIEQHRSVWETMSRKEQQSVKGKYDQRP